MLAKQASWQPLSQSSSKINKIKTMKVHQLYPQSKTMIMSKLNPSTPQVKEAFLCNQHQVATLELMSNQRTIRRQALIRDIIDRTKHSKCVHLFLRMISRCIRTANHSRFESGARRTTTERSGGTKKGRSRDYWVRVQ